ncbi:glycosyltransferase [Chryseosolibacter indicus]|uniref:Glycosyltransferase n=1 Tax=Chryseosolibacter indicus TaxID=2782351 RepID=A0ABS5VVN9_9BACT|nr:glycosyltransferase [Chryseosolibacter indicus]MBT1705497.1 glycosyltransferase [Chryseosolibacter indicus]
MKILFITPWYPDRLSGNSGAFIQTQAQALAKKHLVMVLSSKIDYSKFAISSYELSHSKSDNLSEHRLIVYRSLPVINQLIYFLITCKVAIEICKGAKPDIIQASIGYPGSILGWVISKYFKVPYVFNEHTLPINNFRSFFHKQLTLFGMKRAKAIITVSNYLASKVKSVIPNYTNIVVIPNVINIKRFVSVEKRKNSIPHIGFLGGMNTNVKGLDILLEALQDIRKDFRLYIGGSGKLENTFRIKAVELGLEDKCIFFGFVPYQDVPSFMSNLDFFVCSSRYETFCVALVEAMASGLPVVSTKCGGPEDFVNDENGILCDPKDVSSLRTAIENMLTKYHEFDRSMIQKYVFKNYAESSFLERIEHVYHDVFKH